MHTEIPLIFLLNCQYVITKQTLRSIGIKTLFLWEGSILHLKGFPSLMFYPKIAWAFSKNCFILQKKKFRGKKKPQRKPKEKTVQI